MAGSMGKDHWIAADSSFTTDLVIFDVAPRPLPTTQATRNVIQEQILPTINTNGKAVPAGIVFTDMGAHKTQQKLNLSMEYMSSDNVDILWKLWWDNAVIYYTPDNKSTVYTLQWNETGLNTVRPPGIRDWYTVQLAFYVLDVTTTEEQG